MIDRFERFCFAVASMSRYIQKIETDELEKMGLKGSYALYLIILDRYPQGLTATELCEQCEKDKAAVSRAIAAMEKQGLVSRNSGTHSPYRAPIVLTEAGKQAADHVRQKAIVAVSHAGTGISDEDRITMYATLEKIAANLHIISKEGIPHQ